VHAALPYPSVLGLAGHWSVQPVAIVAILLAAGWYLRGLRQLHRAGTAWPIHRVVAFIGGLAGFGWATNGFLQTYSHALFWIYLTQLLLIFLILPGLVLAGQPVLLSRLTKGDRAALVRLVGSRAGRLFASPLVGPALVPLISAALFFGPLPGWAISQAAVGWPLQVAVFAAGAFVALPLISAEDSRGSLAVGLALAVGAFELVLDAIPGIALRLHTTLVSNYFDYRSTYSWTPRAIRDQQIGGAILWTLAELIDLPFLVLVYRSWIRADERDAARIDTVLAAERIARGEDPDTTIGESDAPWWLDDPAVRGRLDQS